MRSKKNSLLIGVGSFVLCLVLGTSNGSAQIPTITTYVGPPLPIVGQSALEQDIGSPRCVLPDGVGGFYVSTSQNKVYRVTADGVLTLVAGTTYGFSGDGGPATTAQLNTPFDVALDATGNLYIADSWGSRIRKVTRDGVISTIAGNGTQGFGGDGGPATAAKFYYPSRIALDTGGSLYISEEGNNRIRKVRPDGVISTIAGDGTAGFGGDGGPATAAQLYLPAGIAVDAIGNLYFADVNNYRVRKVAPDGTITTVAGNGTFGFSGDGGLATAARLSFPYDVALDSAGNLYIADVSTNRIRKVTPDGMISTVAGNGSSLYSGDGGPATAASITSPTNLALDAEGRLYIGDSSGRVRRVTLDGVIRTVAGAGTFGFSGDGGPASAARLRSPSNVATDGTGNLYFTDRGNSRIRKVTPAGVISTIAGNGGSGFGQDGGPATASQLAGPSGIAVDASGVLYIADTNNNSIRTVGTDGVIRSLPTGYTAPGRTVPVPLSLPQDVAIDAAGNIYIADTGHASVLKKPANGVCCITVAGSGTKFGNLGDGGPATAASLYPQGITLDSAGNLYIADGEQSRIRKVTPSGLITTIAGNGSAGFSGDGGAATAAQLYLNLPGLAVDNSGNLYISDGVNYRIRKVTPEGIISTVAGVSPGFTGDGGPAVSAQLSPAGIALDAAGSLYVADVSNHRIRKITQLAPANLEHTFTIADRGGASLTSAGNSGTTVVGYGRIHPNSGSSAPAGLAIFGFRQGGVLVSEAGVPALPPIQSGRIYAEISGSVNTGIAIANPNSQPATISFFFTGSNGNFGNGTATIPANGQIAAFLNQPPFNGSSSLNGAFTFSSAVPVAVIALRGLTNERGEFLITTLPVADLSAPAAGSALVFPDFADGGGWTTQIVLVNPGDSILTGTVQFLNPSGGPATVTVAGQTNTSFGYSIPARSSQKLQTSGAGTSILSGSVRAVPAANVAAPSGLAIFSFRNGGTTVAEAGVPAVPAGIAFRLYAEAAGVFTTVGSIQTGVAVANTSASAATVTLELNKLDGSSTGLTGTLSIPANGQTAIFLNQIQGFASLQTPFQGVLRVSSAAPISVTGLRGRYNERSDFLITTTPAVNEATAASAATLFFPQVADSGGYTTQFILFSGSAGQLSSGSLSFYSQSGEALNLTIR